MTMVLNIEARILALLLFVYMAGKIALMIMASRAHDPEQDEDQDDDDRDR